MRLRCLAIMVLALLTAFASDSWSKNPTPPPTQSGQLDQTSKPNARGTEQSPLIIKVLPTKESEEKTTADARHEDEKAKNDRRLALFTERLFWATVALSVIAVFQLGVFGWQGIQLRETVRATKDATSLANKEFISTHRPKIALHSVKYGAVENIDLPVSVEFRYVNTGDTEGHVTEVGTRLIYTKDQTVKSDLDFRVKKIDPPMEIKSGEFGLGLTVEKNDLNLDAGIYARYDETKLFCVAYIAYRDGLLTPRQMGFCRQYHAQTHRWVRVDDSEYEYSY